MKHTHSQNGHYGGQIDLAVPFNTVVPSIVGTVEVGQVLTIDYNGAWSGSPTSFAFRWYADSVVIGGATSATFTVTSTQLGAYITADVIATNTVGASTAAVSNILGPVIAAAILAPSNTTAPLITGTPRQGYVLSTSDGVWDNTPTSYTYQWKQAGGVSISGATTATYLLVSGDVNSTITCTVTAINAAGSIPAASNSLGPVSAAVVPTNTTAPSISGTAYVGQVLTCDDGVWTADPFATFTRQWKRNTVAISGEVNQTYTLTNTDLTKTITCTVTASNVGGSAAPLTTAGVGPIGTLAPILDTSIAAPVISLAVSATTYPPEFDITASASVQAGTHSVEFENDDDIAFGSMLIDDTLSISDTEAAAAVKVDTNLTLVTTPTITYSRARFRWTASTIPYCSEWSNIQGHGGASAPSITSSASFSSAENSAVLKTITASQTCTYTIAGADGALIEKVGSEPATSIQFRLTGNALPDYETKASYSFTVTPTNLSAVAGYAQTITLTITDVSDTATPVDVIIQLGDSNEGSGIRNNLTDIPAGYYTTDSSSFFYDGRGQLGTAGAIQTLIAPSYSTVTVTIASPGVFTWTAHGLSNGAQVTLSTTGALPTGLSDTVDGTRSTIYYVVSAATNTFSLSATRGGSAINTSGSQSGTHTAVANAMLQQQPTTTSIDSSNTYNRCIGNAYEIVRQYRVEHATDALYFFDGQYGGGGFTDLSGAGRAANWTYSLTDGAYNSFKTHWAAFVAALAAINKTPNIIVCAISLGGNDALNSASGTHGTNVTNLIAQLRTDIIGSAKVVLKRVNNTSQTALSGVAAAVTTIRAADQTIVQADPTRVEMFTTDGFTCITDNLHWGTPSIIIDGKYTHKHGFSLWYPSKEFAFNGGNPPVHSWVPGDFRNSIVSSAVQTLADVAGTAYAPTQSDPTKRPAIVTTTLSNGLPARYATGDGSNDFLSYSSGANLGTTNGVFAAMSAPVTATKVGFSEGGSGVNPFVGHLTSGSAGTGKLRFIANNDAGGTAADLDLQVVAFDGNMNFVAKWETGGTVTGHANGTSGSGVAYTRGTITLVRTSLYANVAGGVGGLWMNAKIGHLWTTAAIPDATYLSNARAYTQRDYGTA